MSNQHDDGAFHPKETYPLHLTIHTEEVDNNAATGEKDTPITPVVADSQPPAPSPPPKISPNIQNSFRRDGFYVFHNVFDKTTVSRLNDRLEEVLRGRYDRGIKPDKTPRLIKSELTRREKKDCCCQRDDDDDDYGIDQRNIEFVGKQQQEEGQKKKKKKKKKKATTVGPLGYSGNTQNVRVLQVINVHKSDKLFRALATNQYLGKLVSELAGWECGARLAQDQVWAKPPGAPPLVFHRDSPYFMFTPSDVVTVWVALDDMDEELGPLRYVKGSHKWGDGRVGSANKFFQSDGGTSLLYSAAEREGITGDVSSQLEFVSMGGLKAGGISVHDGRTWHGSGRKESKDRPRRGIGLHFVPANVRFTADARKSSLWRKYIPNDDECSSEDVENIELPEEDFPVTWEGQA